MCLDVLINGEGDVHQIPGATHFLMEKMPPTDVSWMVILVREAQQPQPIYRACKLQCRVTPMDIWRPLESTRPHSRSIVDHALGSICVVQKSQT